jgi:hypothetical protein
LILDIVCNHRLPDGNGSQAVVYADGHLTVASFNDNQGMYHHGEPMADLETLSSLPSKLGSRLVLMP